MTCPYCGKDPCPTPKDCAEAYDKLRRQDKAAFAHFTRGLPIKRDAA